MRFVFVGDSPFPFCTILHLSAPILILLHCPRFLISTTLSLSYHAFSLMSHFLSHTTLSHSYHAFSISPRFLISTTLFYSYHAFSLVPRFVSFTDHAFSLIPRFPDSCHAFSLFPRFLTLTTLSHSYHAFPLVPRFLTLTMLSHSYHAFSLVPRFPTRTTLSHSYHAFSFLPRFLTRTTLSLPLTPDFFSPTIHHSFQLLPPLSSSTMVSISPIFPHHHLYLPPQFLTSGLSTCPVEVPKMNVLPKGNLVDPEENTTTTRSHLAK